MPRLVLAALLLGLLVVAPGSTAQRTDASAPPAARDLEVTVQDDALLLHRPAREVRATVRQLARLGADRLRITAGWSALAPAPGSRRRPGGFRAADPREYRNDQMRRLDRAVTEAGRAGLAVQLDLAFWAPRWAVERGFERDRERWGPDAEEFGRFAAAMARRYDGTFRGLPAVRLWTTWNEPNHPVFLLPQRTRGADGRWRLAAPHVYRALHEAAYDALKRSDPGNRVLLGGLSAKGGRRADQATRGIAPLQFTRELACVDADLEPLQIPECRDYRPLRADGFSHHPYSFETAPDVSATASTEVPLADVGKLSGLLSSLHARGRLAQPLELYLTEYGYETDPPDPGRGIAPGRQARYHGQATYLAWRTPGVRMFAQFLVRDIGPDRRFAPRSRQRWSGYQTGMYDFRGRPKPLVDAFRMPFWVQRQADGRLMAFGQVRPGDGPQTVVVERRGPDGRWRAHGPQLRTDGEGFVHVIGAGPPGAYRLHWLSGGGGRARSVAVPVG